MFVAVLFLALNRILLHPSVCISFIQTFPQFPAPKFNVKNAKLVMLTLISNCPLLNPKIGSYPL